MCPSGILLSVVCDVNFLSSVILFTEIGVTDSDPVQFKVISISSNVLLTFGDYLFSKHIQNSIKFTGYHDTR